MVNYPIGDFLIQIKNASLVGKKQVTCTSTKFIKAVADTLKKEGVLSDVKKDGNQVTVVLAFHKKTPVLIDLKIISKPGLRRYMSAEELEKVKGPSMFVVSTSKGVMSSKDAIKSNLGGEIIAQIW